LPTANSDAAEALSPLRSNAFEMAFNNSSMHFY
jgi:hypothetical protein